MKSEPNESKSSERSPNIIQEPDDDDENDVVNSIKTENIDISDNEDDEKNTDFVEPDAKQIFKIATENTISRSSLLSATAAGSMSLNASTSGNDDKYCQTCDIRFKYLNSYLAHKKSYCRNIQNDLDIDSVAQNQATVIATTRSSPNQTSVVT